MGFRDCIRKDLAKLIVILILPIVALLALSYFFSGVYIEKIPFGIINQDSSELSRSIVQGFENHPGIKIKFYGSTEQELQEAIMTKKIAGGLIIPANFGSEIREKKSPKSIMIVDATNLIISNNLMSYSNAILGTFNAGAQMSVLEGKNMLPTSASKTMTSFSIVDRTLYDSTLSYKTYMIYVLAVLLIQMFYLNFFFLPMLMDEKEYFKGRQITFRAMFERIGPILTRTSIMILTICTSTFIGFVLSYIYFAVPVRGNILAYYAMMSLFFISLSIMSLVIVLALTDKNYVYYIQFYSIMNLMFFFTAGTVWPEYMIPKAFMTVVRCLWPYVYFANPMKYLNLKGLGWDLLWPYIANSLVFCFGWLAIAIVLYALRNYRLHKAAISK